MTSFLAWHIFKILPVQFFDSSNGIRSRSGIFKKDIIPNTIHVLLLLVTVLRCRSNGRHVERIHYFTNLFLETILLLEKLFSSKKKKMFVCVKLVFLFHSRRPSGPRDVKFVAKSVCLSNNYQRILPTLTSHVQWIHIFRANFGLSFLIQSRNSEISIYSFTKYWHYAIR